MENGKRKLENAASESSRGNVSEFRFSLEKICSACGTAATRDFAKFCRVCGKFLIEEYQPLDNLCASYRWQGKSFQIAHTKQSEPIKTERLFKENRNPASATASAFVVYSLVPYLGILFCPFALLTGGFGVLTAYRKPYLGGGKTSIYSIVLTVIIFAVQILLWWLLYIIPEMGRNN